MSGSHTSVLTRLAEECKRSPRKAALLGVLAAVAAWAWGSRLGGPAAPEPHAPPVAPGPVPPGPPGPGSQPSASAAGLKLPWQQWLQQIRAQSWAQVPGHFSQLPSPFHRTWTGPKEQNPADSSSASPATAAPAQSEPPSWTLDGVSLGSRQRVALISGRPYTLGDSLVWKDQVWKLVRITAQAVELEGPAGNTLRLSLPTPAWQKQVHLRPIAVSSAQP